MSEEDRRTCVEALPSSVPFELHPPEGDRHSRAKDGAVSALQEFFRRVGKKIYVSKELATYYPGEPLFCPDVLAVRDVELHPREKWVVSDEGKGLDFVLEVHVSGDRTKDFETNVRRYARLGIPEYFAFDRRHMRLSGWRLPEPSARAYVPIVPQAGKFTSAVLQLELALEAERIRFYFGTAPLAEAEELVQRLEKIVDEVTERAQQEAERAQQEAERAQQEAERAQQEAERAETAGKRADDLERRLALALAELEKLRSR
jgi:Uma2 family endonuclease